MCQCVDERGARIFGRGLQRVRFENFRGVRESKRTLKIETKHWNTNGCNESAGTSGVRADEVAGALSGQQAFPQSQLKTLQTASFQPNRSPNT